MNKRVPVVAILILLITVLATWLVFVYGPSDYGDLILILPFAVMAGVWAALIAWWLWDRKLFAGELGRLRGTGRWPEVLAGELMYAAFDDGLCPRRGQAILVANADGMSIFDPRTPGEEAVWSVSWSQVSELDVQSRFYRGRTRRGVKIVTPSGRLIFAVRFYEKLGVFGSGILDARPSVDKLLQVRSPGNS